MTTVYPDVQHQPRRHDRPDPDRRPRRRCDPNGQANGCFKGWAMFHVISASGGSDKDINGYFTERLQATAVDGRRVHR